MTDSIDGDNAIMKKGRQQVSLDSFNLSNKKSGRNGNIASNAMLSKQSSTLPHVETKSLKIDIKNQSDMKRKMLLNTMNVTAGASNENSTDLNQSIPTSTRNYHMAK